MYHIASSTLNNAPPGTDGKTGKLELLQPMFAVLFNLDAWGQGLGSVVEQQTHSQVTGSIPGRSGRMIFCPVNSLC